MQNAMLDEAQAGINSEGSSINNLKYADDITLMAKQRTKDPVDESERGEWKSWLKTENSEKEDYGINLLHGK